MLEIGDGFEFSRSTACNIRYISMVTKKKKCIQKETLKYKTEHEHSLNLT